MEELAIEKLLARIPNRFVLSLAAAKRSRQLKDGAVPLVDLKDQPELIVALSEIMAEKINISLEAQPEEKKE